MGLPIGSGDAECLALAQPAAIGLFDRVVWVFGWVPSIGVSLPWSSPLLGHFGKLVAEGAGGHGASICSSVVSPKEHAKPAVSSIVSPRSLVRSVRPHLANPLLLDSHCWGCQWSFAGRAVQSLVNVVWAWWAWRWWGTLVGSCGSPGRYLTCLLATNSDAAVPCFYGLCCWAESSPTGSHLLATWQPPSSCNLLRVT